VKNFEVDDTRIKTIGFGKSDTANEEPKIDTLVYSEVNAAPAQPQAPGRH
jgi:hypothetical protein